MMTGAIFGTAAFVWAGWAQERPPAGWWWRVVLGAISAGGVVLVVFAVPSVIRNWGSATAIDFGSAAFTWYVVVFWLEVIAIVVLAIVLSRMKRGRLIPPLVLIIVGVHFVPLAVVFAQPIMMLTAVLIVAAGVAAIFLPRKPAAPSFWCGILGAPIFLAVGTICYVAAAGALTS